MKKNNFKPKPTREVDFDIRLTKKGKEMAEMLAIYEAYKKHKRCPSCKTSSYTDGKGLNVPYYWNEDKLMVQCTNCDEIILTNKQLISIADQLMTMDELNN